MKIRKRNPFRVSFLAVAVICCVALSIVFYCISNMNSKAIQKKHVREKAEMSMEELETQLQLMEEIALKIVSDYEFWPSYMKKSISRQWDMLEKFERYKYYSTLSDEYFLDYGEEMLYLSSGRISYLETFIDSKSEDEEEKQRFLDELAKVREGLTRICGEPQMVPVFDEIYVLIPLRIEDNLVHKNVILGFLVETDDLERRFRIASGEMKGRITLYGDEGILYSSHEQPVLAEEKDVVTVISKNEDYTICYLPQEEYSLQIGLFFLQLLMILIDAALVLIVANIFAEKTYEPVRVLAETYSSQVLEKKKPYKNALEELKFTMDKVLQSNMESVSQIQENQRIILNQVLGMILSGSNSWELQSYMEKAQIDLPGPLYCVISISFEEEEGVTEEFLSDLQKELEQIPDTNEKERVYAITNMESKTLNVICSIYSEESKEEFLETICDVAESFAYKPVIGIGNTYKAWDRLCASYLESMDKIQDKKKKNGEEKLSGFIYYAEDIQRIMSALESGSEEAALERLKNFVEKMEQSSMSMLMIQYILAEFLSEMTRLSEKYHLEVSMQNVCLLVSVKNVHDFEMVAREVIHDLSKKSEVIRNYVKESEAKKICEYIKEHFMEYDISSESVAAYFHVSTDIVRQAVLLHTGKLYRDYLIYLRIEYAKVLLLQEDISVSELCQKIGYGNVSHFIKMFRESTGVTPAKYRKSVRNM